ncbi:MAG: hypothetical protein BGO07_01615 [Alphaproteobacteria bacterium 40-19]|nr:MAG: hypothetical protein BGO07_01615 [Alphaproteobacteria bacterium 40-19]
MLKNSFFCLLCVFCFGCQGPQSSVKSTTLENLKKLSSSQFSADELIRLISDENLPEASAYINRSLQASPQQPTLHLINGLVYQTMSERGFDGTEGLASAAFQASFTSDPNWISAYFLGLEDIKNKDFSRALEHLSDALILNPKDEKTLYALGYAAYYAGDLYLASCCMEKAASINPKNPDFLRSIIFISAACGKQQKALAYLEKYKKLVGPNHASLPLLAQRLADWKQFYQRPEIKLIEGNMPTLPGTDLIEDIEGKKPNEENIKKIEEQDITSLVFDCYMFQSNVEKTTSKGLNLMGFLQLAAPSKLFSWKLKRKLERDTGGQNASSPVSGSWNKTFDFAMDLSLSNYSLNLMNATETTASLIARPVVNTLVGQRVSLTNGENFKSAVAGQTGSTSFGVSAGINVQICPLSISPEGVVTLEIGMQGSYFTNRPIESRPVDQQVISRVTSKITTVVKATIGQTVVLGGIYTQDNARNTDRTPILGDIPLVQYAFSNEQTRSRINSLLYCITVKLGGAGKHLQKKEAQALHQAKNDVYRKLRERGVLSIGEYGTMYYIMKALEKAPMFINFRSGDLVMPTWSAGYGVESLSQKLDRLAGFLYF